MPNNVPIRDDAASPDETMLKFSNVDKTSTMPVEEYYADGAKPSERPQEDMRLKTNYKEK